MGYYLTLIMLTALIPLGIGTYQGIKALEEEDEHEGWLIWFGVAIAWIIIGSFIGPLVYTAFDDETPGSSSETIMQPIDPPHPAQSSD